MATETEATDASSLGDEWQWISNDTAGQCAEVLRSTVECAFKEDPRRNWAAKGHFKLQQQLEEGWDVLDGQSTPPPNKKLSNAREKRSGHGPGGLLWSPASCPAFWKHF